MSMPGTNRHRTMSPNVRVAPQYRNINGVTSSGWVSCQSKINEMWDVEDPDWKDKLHKWIRHAQPLPVNPMRQIGRELQSASLPVVQYTIWTRDRWNNSRTSSYAVVDADGSGGSRTLWNASSGIRTIKNVPVALSNLYPSEFSEGAKNGLLQKALAKARTASWDVGTFVAELNKTSRMIRSVGRSFTNRTEKVLNSGAIKNYAEFSSSWLEYRYGWRILYYDIMELNESILRLRDLNPLSSRYTSYEESVGTPLDYYEGNRTVTGHVGGTNFSLDYLRVNTKRSYMGRRTLRAGVFLQVDPGRLAFVDPLNTAIEILPWALVANWFLNIKDLIAAWSPFATGKIVHGFLTETQDVVATHQYTSHSIVLPSHMREHTVSDLVLPSSEVVFFDKTRVRREPVMNLRFRLNMDWTHLVDFLAILSVKVNSVKNLRGR